MRGLVMLAAVGMALVAGFPFLSPQATAGRVDGAECAELPSRTIAFGEAKFLIEHNSTDEDTGFQGFVDGEPWKELRIINPQGQVILEVEPSGKLRRLGLTELFFETQEPANDEVPIKDLLAMMPAGKYSFRGTSVAGQPMAATANLTHTIPAGPVIVTPADGATVDPSNFAVDWKPVTTTINGGPVDIVAYELIVERDTPVKFPDAFAKIVMSVHVPPSVTKVTVPREFLQAGTPYKFEVLAIEKSGNQTITAGTFRTR
jgi:hypothetical protein